MSLALQLQEREEIGKEIGFLADKISSVRNNKEEATEERIMKFLRIDKMLYDKISEMIENNPDMNDWEIAENILGEERR